jgi:hypothetical protein
MRYQREPLAKKYTWPSTRLRIQGMTYSSVRRVNAAPRGGRSDFYVELSWREGVARFLIELKRVNINMLPKLIRPTVLCGRPYDLEGVLLGQGDAATRYNSTKHRHYSVADIRNDALLQSQLQYDVGPSALRGITGQRMITRVGVVMIGRNVTWAMDAAGLEVDPARAHLAEDQRPVKRKPRGRAAADAAPAPACPADDEADDEDKAGAASVHPVNAEDKVAPAAPTGKRRWWRPRFGRDDARPGGAATNAAADAVRYGVVVDDAKRGGTVPPEQSPGRMSVVGFAARTPAPYRWVGGHSGKRARDATARPSSASKRHREVIVID